MMLTFSGWYQGCLQDLNQVPELAGAFFLLLLLGQGIGSSGTPGLRYSSGNLSRIKPTAILACKL